MRLCPETASMAISTLCPNCKAVFRLPDNLAGRKVKCQKCQEQFTVPKAEAGSEAVPTIPAPQPKASPDAPKPKLPPIQLSEAESKPAKAKKKFDDDAPEADSKPAKAKKKFDDDAPEADSKPAKAKKKFDDDDVPLDAFEDDDTQKRRKSAPPPIGANGKSKSKSRDEDDDEDRRDDDEDDRPRRRRKRPKQDSTGPWLMVGVLGAVVVVLIGLGAGGWYLFSGDPAPPPIVQLPPPGNPPIGVPPIGVPPVGGGVFGNLIAANLDGNGFFSQNNRINAGDTAMPQPDGGPPRVGKAYSVQFDAGATYQIDMRSNELDAFLLLYDPQGNFLTLNDDNFAEKTLDSRIVWTAKTTGAHRIFATSLDGGDQGGYRFEIRRLGGVPNPKLPDPKFPDPPGGAEITVVFDATGFYSQNGQLTLNDRRDIINKCHKVYRVPFEAGKKYTIDLKSNELDSYLYLYSPTGQLLDQNDDFMGLDSRIVHTATQTGSYIVRATNLFGDRMGNYTFSVRRENGPAKIDPFPKKDPFPKIDPFPKKDPFPKIDPMPKVDPKPSNVSIAQPPTQTGSASIRQLNLPGPANSIVYPVWSADGKSLFHSTFDGNIHRIRADDFVVDSVANLGRAWTDLALSSEGLVVMPSGIPAVWVVDPTSFKTTRTIQIPIGTYTQVAAVPGSHLAVVYTLSNTNIGLIDLKEGRLLEQNIQKRPTNLTAIRALGLSPDGRIVLVQGNTHLHRLRVENNQLLFEDSTPFTGKLIQQFIFSPDGKTVGYSAPTTTKAKAGTEPLKFYQANSWTPVPVNFPFLVRCVAFTSDGALLAQSNDDASLHLLPAPGGAGKAINLGWSNGRLRVIAPQPQGPGMLVFASQTGSAVNQRAYFVEPTAK
jgi:predicted Zn finger-like uncharacterized protein